MRNVLYFKVFLELFFLQLLIFFFFLYKCVKYIHKIYIQIHIHTHTHTETYRESLSILITCPYCACLSKAILGKTSILYSLCVRVRVFVCITCVYEEKSKGIFFFFFFNSIMLNTHTHVHTGKNFSFHQTSEFFFFTTKITRIHN